MSSNTATATNHLDSYPPPFRQVSRLTTPDRVDSAGSARDDSATSDPIPVIDFQWLTGTKVDNLNRNKLREACRDWGVFRLVNHGVPPDLLKKLEDYARELFSLSFESKKALFNTPNNVSYFWGTPALTPSGAALSTNINWVEGLNVPLSQLPQLQSHDQYITSFRRLLEEYGRHLGRLATAIFLAISQKLNNVETKAKSKPNLSESTGLLRVYRYPPYSDDDSKGEGDHPVRGMDVHTDSSVLSILNQDQVGGLEVLKDDQWFTVKPISNTLIVNLGDMMQAISNDEYKSVKHRVKANKFKERVSICYFVFPSEESVIKNSKYKPFTYSDFQAQVQRDVEALGYKVGLERFRITNAFTEGEAC